MHVIKHLIFISQYILCLVVGKSKCNQQILFLFVLSSRFIQNVSWRDNKRLNKR